MIRSGLTDALGELAMAVADREPVLELLHRLAECSHRILPVDSAGVLIKDSDGAWRYATATDDMARAFEEAQVKLSEGPCMVSQETGRAVAVPDLDAATADYPGFAPAAVGLGIRAAFAFPLAVRDEKIGCLNLLCREPGDVAENERHAAQLLADLTAAYIVNRRALEESEELARQLQEALDSRVVIEQAKGMIAQQLGVDVEDAFPILRIYARRGGVRVHEAARRVVDGDLEPTLP
jgi:GAF domain-containing protein